MKKKNIKLIVTIFILFLETALLSGMAQERPVWERYYDRCRRDRSFIDTLPSLLEKNLHWSPTVNKEQKEVIRYILWNMVYVEGGTMNMGENNAFPTTVHSFFINRYEVSQDEWYVIMGKNPSNLHRRDYPVDQICWFDAEQFTKKLSKLCGLPFRLPFEAEWEYAARGGVKTQNYIYAGSNNPTEVARFKTRIKSENTYVSQVIGKMKPNELGLYDMSGNIYEWCMDWYDKNQPFTGITDPALVGENFHKVLRGGSYYTFEKYCKITSRYGVNPHRWDIDYGLRLVISLPENQ